MGGIRGHWVNPCSTSCFTVTCGSASHWGSSAPRRSFLSPKVKRQRQPLLFFFSRSIPKCPHASAFISYPISLPMPFIPLVSASHPPPHPLTLSFALFHPSSFFCHQPPIYMSKFNTIRCMLTDPNLLGGVLFYFFIWSSVFPACS